MNTMSGYSRKPLSQKPGIRPGMCIVALGAPGSSVALLGDLPPGATVQSRLPSVAQFIHRFVSRSEELQAEPKKTSGVATDLNENLIRDNRSR